MHGTKEEFITMDGSTIKTMTTNFVRSDSEGNRSANINASDVIVLADENLEVASSSISNTSHYIDGINGGKKDTDIGPDTTGVLKTTPPSSLSGSIKFDIPFVTQGRGDRGITVMCSKLQTEHDEYSVAPQENPRSFSNLTAVWKDCLDHRSGNALSSFFGNRYVADHAGIIFQADSSSCDDESLLKLLGPPLPLNLFKTNTAASKEACSSCTEDPYSMPEYPHTCRNYNMTAVVSVIRKEFGSLAKSTLTRHPELKDEIDDVSIHLRLLDMLGCTKRYDMGLTPFPAYVKIIPNDVTTIGIVTAPYEPESESETIAIGLQSFLAQHYPKASISIRNSRNDTTAMVFTRIIKARRLSICTASTYCVYPTLGAEGIGVLLPSPLYGGKHPNWVDKLGGVKDLRIRIPNIRYISKKNSNSTFFERRFAGCTNDKWHSQYQMFFISNVEELL